MLTHLYESTLRVEPRDEYRAERKYYKVNQNLTSIPTDIPPDALQVNITLNSIIKIEANAFSNLSQCEKIYLTRNMISEVETGAFNGLNALKWLFIDHNELKVLHAKMSSNLADFTVLNVKITRSEKYNLEASLDSVTLEPWLLFPTI